MGIIAITFEKQTEREGPVASARGRCRLVPLIPNKKRPVIYTISEKSIGSKGIVRHP